jgi:hypothetical protein
MRTSISLVGCAAALAVVARAAAAQHAARGSVTDSVSSSPIAGAVVTLLGPNGASLGRTVTGAGGEFSLAVAGAAVHARVVRIGFKPRDVDLSPGDGDQPIRIRMSRLPPLLDAVRVSGRELCPTSTDQGGAFTLWEQVHAGLLAAVVARQENPATATTLTYERREDPSDHLVEHQVQTVRSGRTTRPFVAAASPQQFASAGYLSADTSGRKLFAPDADVLLDESFAATHCFRLQNADATHRGQIGLAFTPAQRRDSTVDVTGVIWVDAVQPALRSLDFRHTGLDAAWARTPPGGHLEFQTAQNGVSFIERWLIDVPIVRLRLGSAATFGAGRMTSSQPDRINVDAVYVSGGSVVAARWPDGASWAGAPTGISGVVTERGTAHPVAGALVSIEGTADTIVTDSLGRFELAPMVPGRYLVRVADTTLEAFARGRADSRVVDVDRDHLVDVPAQLPAIGEKIAQVCKNVGSVFRSVLVGHVVLDSAAVDRGRVRASWRVNLGGHAMDLNRDDAVDAHGRFLVCGLPSDVQVDLQWSAGGAHADTVVTIGRGAVGRIEWQLPTRRPNGSPPR